MNICGVTYVTCMFGTPNAQLIRLCTLIKYSLLSHALHYIAIMYISYKYNSNTKARMYPKSSLAPLSQKLTLSSVLLFYCKKFD
jgi:hypothetical protein